MMGTVYRWRYAPADAEFATLVEALAWLTAHRKRHRRHVLELVTHDN